MLRQLMMILILMVVVRTGLAIHCWQCNSFHDSECSNVPSGPQENATLAENIRKFYLECDHKYKLCRKQEQEIDHTVRIIRSCGLESSGKECYKTANPQVKTFVCECDKDGCNLSPRLTLNSFLIFSSILISMSISFLRFYK